MNSEKLQQLIKYCGYAPFRYNGKDTSAHGCMGFATEDTLLEVVAAFIEESSNPSDDLPNLVRNMKVDGITYYFPGVAIYPK